ncbi:MAG TPA: group 1 truncated hemoglobin, partial [Polyangiaceae bacterium]|nr:group 1 truncated hemoglobin [Polyangiaceae bacterium]
MHADRPPSSAETTPFERLGGRLGIEPIISDFVDRVVGDIMIGFFFKKVPIDRLKQLELEYACEHLGAHLMYTGRPLKSAHGPHRIMGGQFNRRLRILEQTLRDHAVPEDILEHWLAHNEA